MYGSKLDLFVLWVDLRSDLNKLGSTQDPNTAYQVSKTSTLWFWRRFWKTFTIYECGCLLGHVFVIIPINFGPFNSWILHRKFGSDWSCSFRNKTLVTLKEGPGNTLNFRSSFFRRWYLEFSLWAWYGEYLGQLTTTSPKNVHFTSIYGSPCEIWYQLDQWHWRKGNMKY